MGLTLQVTPHVHDGNSIRLQIQQEVEEIDTTTLAIGENLDSSDIITSKRTIETTVLADDGEVVVLGGLIRDRQSTNESGVPGLKDVPVLGYLFKNRTNRIEKNLMVFLRATVLKTREDVIAQTKRKYSRVWEVEISGRDPSEAVNDLFDGKR